MNIKKTIFFYLFFLLFSPILLNAESFRILTNEEPPTNYLDTHNNPIGITVDIVKELKHRLNIKANIEIMTWARAYTIAQKEKNIIIFTAGKTKKRIKEGFHFIGPVITRKHTLFANTNKDINISNLLDIKFQDLTVGAMREDWRSRYFIDRGIKTKEVSNHSQNLQKLLVNRIDLWATSDIEAPIIAKKANIKVNTFKKALVFKEASSYIMISKSTPLKEVHRIKDEFKKLQETNFFINNAKKWNIILNLNLNYSKEKGYFQQ